MARDIPTKEELVSWFKTLSNWGRWGKDDELGTLNLITAEKRLQAARLVQDGLAISCARTITYDPTPDGPLPTRHFMMKSGEGEAPEVMGRSNNLDVFMIAPHGSTITHLDAPSHTAWRSSESEPWTIYNGKPRNLVRTVDGATVGSIELAGDGIVSRGVLLDVARLQGVPWLDPHYTIFPEDLEAAEKAQNVRVEPGDILFVRTGYPRMRHERGPRPTEEGRPSIQAACLPWLRERDVALLSCDGGHDPQPSEYPGLGRNPAIHGIGMGAIGLWLLDNPDLEELGEACHARSRWAFQAVIASLKLQNGTGCPVNPIAVL